MGSLKDIKPEDQTEEMCLEAVMENGLELEYVDPRFLTTEVITEAVKQDALSLFYVPNDLRTEDLYDFACTGNGYILKYLYNDEDEKKKITKYMCLSACSSNAYALAFVPRELLSKEMILRAYEENYLEADRTVDYQELTHYLDDLTDEEKTRMEKAEKYYDERKKEQEK